MITVTTATLSQWHSTHWPLHCIPHTTIENSIGSSSFGAIDNSFDRPSHFHWNHLEPHDAPQPHEPDASVFSGLSTGTSFGISEMPFHPSIYFSHDIRSECADSFSLIQWSLRRTAVSSTIKQRTNVRPGWITVAACCRCPRSDSSSLFLHPFLPTHSRTRASVHSSFSRGSRTTISWVSNSKPR